MNNEKKHSFIATLKSGKTVEYEILFTFDSEEMKKSYIIFTDNKVDEAGSIMTYAATYTNENDELKLSDIKTEKEWNLVEKILSQIEDKMEE